MLFPVYVGNMQIEKKKIFVLVIIILAILYAIYYMVFPNYAPKYPSGIIPNSQQISEEEVRAFITTMNKYQQEHQDEISIRNLSLSLSESLTETEPQMTAWLERRGWNAERFFYILSRARIIVSTIKKDEKIMQKQQLIKEAAQAATDPQMKMILKEEAQTQPQSLNVEKISRMERKMIEPYMEELSKIFPHY